MRKRTAARRNGGRSVRDPMGDSRNACGAGVIGAGPGGPAVRSCRKEHGWELRGNSLSRGPFTGARLSGESFRDGTGGTTVGRQATVAPGTQTRRDGHRTDRADRIGAKDADSRGGGLPHADGESPRGVGRRPRGRESVAGPHGAPNARAVGRADRR